MSHAVHSSTDEKPDYFYLRYVTLGQFFKLFKSVVAWWFGLSVGSVVLGLMFHAAKTATVDKTFLSGIPKQFWIWLAVAVFSWVLRGKTITLPKISFVAWILLNVWLGGSAIADAFLPWWAASPIFLGLFLVCFIYEELVKMGQANYASMTQTPETNLES